MTLRTHYKILVYFLISLAALCKTEEKNMDELLNYMDSLSGRNKMNLFQQITFEAASAVFSEAVEANVQAFRYVMTTSNSAMNIPSLDPWTAPDIDFEIFSRELNTNGTFENITVYNLSTYKILQWDTEVLSGTFGIGFDEIKLETNYTVDANTSNIFWISSKDHVTGTIYGFNLTDGAFHFQLENGKLVLKNLTFHLDYDRIQVNFTNMDNGTLVGRLVQESIDYFVDVMFKEQKDDMAKMLANSMTKSMNNIFKSLTLQQLFSVIKSKATQNNKNPGETVYARTSNPQASTVAIENTLEPENTTATALSVSESETITEVAVNTSEFETTADTSMNTTEIETT